MPPWRERRHRARDAHPRSPAPAQVPRARPCRVGVARRVRARLRIALGATAQGGRHPEDHLVRELAEGIAPELAEVWPRRSKFERRCFELLRAAYVKARYSPRFQVAPAELAWMRKRVALLRTQVVAICEARLTAIA